METENSQSIRPTKKQRELLSYIEQFISEHGYSPSYREIMNGLQYTSVATVSLHVNSLIRRGHLRKRDRSARSLEVVSISAASPKQDTQSDSREAWLIGKVDHHFKSIEGREAVSRELFDQLRTLITALEVFGLHEAAGAFLPRLEAIKEKAD